MIFRTAPGLSCRHCVDRVRRIVFRLVAVPVQLAVVGSDLLHVTGLTTVYVSQTQSKAVERS